MDFEAMSDQLNKDKLMNVSIGDTSVLEATETLRGDLNLEPLIEVSENHKITCEEDAKQALSMSMQARKLRKTLEESRMKIVRPHLDFQKAINTVVKDYTSKLQEIETSLKGKLDTWLEVQSTFEPNFSEMMLEVQDGKLTTKVEWDLCVEDFDKIPPSYLMLDEKKVKQAIKMGVRDIPGIKIFENKQTAMRIKNG
jgi:hypothetical protein